MAKKNIMTGIGVNMTAISTDNSFLLGENYCVDLTKECKDLGEIKDLPEKDNNPSQAGTISPGTVTKKFLLTPAWMQTNNPDESLYFTQVTTFTSASNIPSYQTTEGYFPKATNQSSRLGWDKFGKDVTLDYIPVTDPALEITTTQEDLLIGYRNKIYNFMFECNQYAYNLEWSLVNASPGCIISPGGYFSLSETGTKSVSYTFTVRVHNPDTNETATKDFTLTTAHAAFIPPALPIPLGLVGPDSIDIRPHRNFKAVYQAVGGVPPYRFAVDSPLVSQWPYQNTPRFYIHGKISYFGYVFDVNNSSLYKENFDPENVGQFGQGKKIRFEKVPFRADLPVQTPPLEEEALPGGLSFDTDYYCIPVMDGTDWTGHIQFAATPEDAASKTFIPFTGPGAGEGYRDFMYFFPSQPNLDYTGYRANQDYIKTVNRYVDQLAINIAIPPLPKHWGHGNRYDTHAKLEEGDPWKNIFLPTFLGNSYVDHYKTLSYTYDTGLEEWVWDGPTNIYAWMSDDVADVYEPPFLDYSSNIGYGQYLPALGFEEYLGVATNARTPFDPWRYQSLQETATNYIDITVLDFEDNTFTLRVTVEEPDYDFSETCGVPYWKAVMNYYTCPTPTPMTTTPRTEGRIITIDSDSESPTYGKTIVVDYDPDNPDEAPNNELSKTVPVLDDLDKYTFEMTHYYPASRFVIYSSLTKYSVNYETTYYPYEKLNLPFGSIHPNHEFSYQSIIYYRKS
jgi:hypothetical protein